MSLSLSHTCSLSHTVHAVPHKYSSLYPCSQVCGGFLFIYSFIFSQYAATLTRHCGKTNSSYTHTHTRTHASAHSHTSLLTIKKPWPLGSFPAAQRNAPSPRPFIRRNVRLGVEYVNTSGGGLYHLRVSPEDTASNSMHHTHYSSFASE